MAQLFQPEDLFLYHALDELHCVPGLDVAACVVQTVDRASDGYRAAIWAIALDGSVPPRRMTASTSAASSPRWSPDGRTLAFLSAREGPLQQIHLLARDGGEAQQLTWLPAGVTSMEWSPQGDRFLASCPVYIDPNSREAAATRSEPWPPDAPQLVWCVPYKSDGMGYLLGRVIHLFLVDASTGLATQVTSGDFDVLGAKWAPDGKRFTYLRTRMGRESQRTDVWVGDAATGEHRQLTSDIASAQSATWSPDADWIVFAGARKEGDAQSRLWAVPANGGEVRQLGHDDLEVVSIMGTQRGEDGSQQVLVIEAYRSCHRIVSVGISDGAIDQRVGGQRQITSAACTGDRIAMLVETFDVPREVFSCRMDGSDDRCLTSFNGWSSQRTPLTVELRSFEVPDGNGGRETIDGWYVRPAGAQGALPLVIEAHGGPTSYAMVGYPWHTHWYVMLSRGWSILTLNPVGSSGYGREFAQRLDGKWGELDFPQMVAAVESLQAAGLADARLAVTGKSYGGYMSAWAVGHSSIFRAAIVCAPVSNLESHFGTSDGGYYADPYTIAAERHHDADRYRRLSPVQHAHNAVTPTLILQGADDERCPRGQAEEFFTALNRATNTQPEMVLYPGGDHHFYEQGKPSHRLDVVTRAIEWLERWIDKPVEVAQPEADPQRMAAD